MKSIVRYLLAVVCVITTISSFVVAQDLSAELSRVGALNVKNYVNPIFNGFAADLNSGFYHSADLHGVLGFDVGVKVGFSFITASDKKYDFITPDFININNGAVQLHAGQDYDSVVTGVPTAVGDKNTKYYVRMKSSSIYYNTYKAANGGSDVIFQIPNGFDLPAVPLPMPQAAIGLPFGLEVLMRFIPTVSAGDAGNFNYMGFGLRYNLDQFLRKLPAHIAIHFMTQKMNFKSKNDNDIFNATGTAFGIEVSKRFLFLTLYGGVQVEKASFMLNTITSSLSIMGGTPIDFSIPGQSFTGEDKSRATFGLRLLLAIVNLHADYSFAKTPVAAIGVGISFR